MDLDHGAPPRIAGGFQSETLNEQASHITVGHSLFIDTQHRLSRVYITDPDIIDSYTASPNQVVVTAKKPGTTALILWDESGQNEELPDLVGPERGCPALIDEAGATRTVHHGVGQ